MIIGEVLPQSFHLDLLKTLISQKMLLRRKNNETAICLCSIISL